MQVPDSDAVTEMSAPDFADFCAAVESAVARAADGFRARGESASNWPEFASLTDAQRAAAQRLGAAIGAGHIRPTV